MMSSRENELLPRTLPLPRNLSKGYLVYLLRSKVRYFNRKIFKLACRNVQGCNDPAKRECVGRMFVERGLGVLVLTETKLRGRGE